MFVGNKRIDWTDIRVNIFRVIISIFTDFLVTTHQWYSDYYLQFSVVNNSSMFQQPRSYKKQPTGAAAFKHGLILEKNVFGGNTAYLLHGVHLIMSQLHV